MVLALPLNLLLVLALVLPLLAAFAPSEQKDGELLMLINLLACTFTLHVGLLAEALMS